MNPESVTTDDIKAALVALRLARKRPELAIVRDLHQQPTRPVLTVIEGGKS